MALKVLLVEEETGKFKRGVDLFSTFTELGGKVVVSARSVAVNALLDSADYYVGVDSSAGPITVTLPDITTVEVGQEFCIKDEIGQAGVNAITIDGNGALIDGENDFQLVAPRESIKCISRGSFWSII